MQTDYFPIVVQVRPLDNFHVLVYFSDGKIVDYNAKDDLKEGTVFEPLRDNGVFKNTCTVLNETLAWDLTGKRDETDCIDIDPFYLYDLKAVNENISMYEKSA